MKNQNPFQNKMMPKECHHLDHIPPMHLPVRVKEVKSALLSKQNLHQLQSLSQFLISLRGCSLGSLHGLLNLRRLAG